mmetsp:Transcript_6369/g.17631  ORF Transcript_6369/g.17631 Transcript_6369/m.17631 type:complete len:231 (-) Transcript_6369:14-706(-)
MNPMASGFFPLPPCMLYVDIAVLICSDFPSSKPFFTLAKASGLKDLARIVLSFFSTSFWISAASLGRAGIFASLSLKSFISFSYLFLSLSAFFWYGTLSASDMAFHFSATTFVTSVVFSPGFADTMLGRTSVAKNRYALMALLGFFSPCGFCFFFLVFVTPPAFPLGRPLPFFPAFPAGLGEKSLPTVVEIYLKGLLNIFLFVSVSPLVLVGATLGQAGSPWSGGWGAGG